MVHVLHSMLQCRSLIMVFLLLQTEQVTMKSKLTIISSKLPIISNWLEEISVGGWHGHAPNTVDLPLSHTYCQMILSM